jgi:serine/threonine-protein kinase RsbW
MQIDPEPQSLPESLPESLPDAGLAPMRDPPARWAMSLVIPAQLRDVRAALGDVAAALAGEGVGPLDCATAELVLAEVLNNVVEHAYAAAPCAGQPVAAAPDRAGGRRPRPEGRGGTIRIALTLRDAALDVRVEDLGRAMPGRVVPAGEMPDLEGPPESLPEGGWGWAMIRELSQGLHYCRAPGRNVMRFRLPLAGE